MTIDEKLEVHIEAYRAACEAVGQARLRVQLAQQALDEAVKAQERAASNLVDYLEQK